MATEEYSQPYLARGVGSPLSAKLGLQTPSRFVPPMKIPRTMGQMPLVGGTGTAVVNELMHSRNMNTGLEPSGGVEDNSAVQSVMDGVARRAKGKTKRGIFG